MKFSFLISILKKFGASLFLGALFLSSAARSDATTWDRDAVIELSKRGGSDRCGQALEGGRCTMANSWALKNGAITQDAFDWLQESKKWYVTIAGEGVPGSLCQCGCFHPDTSILVANGAGSTEKKASEVTKNDKLFVLDTGSDLDKPSTIMQSIESIVSGFEESPLVSFHLASGRILRVTEEHGMVLANGTMTKAKDVSVGASFVSSSGELVAIEHISREKGEKNATVINFRSASDRHKEHHILVAEDVFVGDIAFQNEYESDLERIRLRK